MKVKIRNKEYPAEYLTTPEEIRQGMMGREELIGCMVFQMGAGYHTFWMKDCLIPLDIVFVFNQKISKIYRNCLPCIGECKQNYVGMGDHVIEFPANTTLDLKVGDWVKFETNGN